MQFRRPDSGLIVAIAALVAAMSGSAVAASLITSKQIKDGTIQLKDISKTARKSLRGKSGAAGAQGAKGDTGAPGAPGAKGDPGTPGADGTPATKIYAFVRTEGCCGGAQPLDPPDLKNAHGVTAAARTGTTGRYEVTFDASLLPDGDATKCVPFVSLGSADAAYSPGGEIGTSIDFGAAANTLMVDYRNSAGTQAEIGSGAGSRGFSIALFC